MPNECRNHMTITWKVMGDPILEEILLLPCMLVHECGKRGIRFDYISAWKPENRWLEELVRHHPTCWAKNEWMCEDGTAGIWVGTAENHHAMEWDDLSVEDEFYYFG